MMKKFLCFSVLVVFLMGFWVYANAQNPAEELQYTAKEFVQLLTTKGLNTVADFVSQERQNWYEEILADKTYLNNLNLYYGRFDFRIIATIVKKDKGTTFITLKLPNVDMVDLEILETKLAKHMINNAPMENWLSRMYWIYEDNRWKLSTVGLDKQIE